MEIGGVARYSINKDNYDEKAVLLKDQHNRYRYRKPNAEKLDLYMRGTHNILNKTQADKHWRDLQKSYDAHVAEGNDPLEYPVIMMGNGSGYSPCHDRNLEQMCRCMEHNQSLVFLSCSAYAPHQSALNFIIERLG